MNLAEASLQTNALYAGYIGHRRYAPKTHAFQYRIFQFYLDISDIENTLKPYWFCSTRRFNCIQYRRSDFFGDSSKPLDAVVRQHVESQRGTYKRQRELKLIVNDAY